MFKKCLILVLTSAVWTGFCGESRAQFLDMSHMVQAELNFQNNFYNNAWQMSKYIASLPSDGQPLPFNAMTLSQANQQASQAWTGYIRQSQANSQALSNAVGNWTNGAVRGYGPYYNPQTGNVYNLPWTHNAYHVDPYGYANPGRVPNSGANLYPYYGR